MENIFKEYFTDAVQEKFNFGNEKEIKELKEYLKELVKISQEELALDILKYQKSSKPITELTLERIDFLKYFEKNLQNIGFISKKSRDYSAKTNIGKLYKIFVDDKSNNIKKTISEIEKESFKEQNLYKPFKKILKQIFKTEKINIINTANLGIEGKWTNPDILLKYDDFYYSYELKRWKDISPIAPHEARNHARHISNYPYVVINVPQKFFEFVIEYTGNFQIIKSDCIERGIGLILFDDINGSFFKLLDANYFIPDPIKKRNYQKKIQTQSCQNNIL